MSDIPTTDVILTEAKELLETEGWIRGGRYRRGEGYCLVGALSHVCSLHRLNFHGVGTPWNMAWLELHHLTGNGVMCWNDTPGRTKDEVLDLLDKAAWNAREGLTDA